MEGCREEKKFCGFEQHLVQNKKYTELLMGENQSLQARFFPAKRLIFWSISGTIPKRRLFFPWTDFPPKDLRVFFYCT